MCVVFGVVAWILPNFGLQFRKLAHFGAASGTAGLGVAACGLFLVAYVGLLKGRMLRLIGAAIVLGALGTAALIALSFIKGSHWQRPDLRAGPHAPEAGMPPHAIGGPPPSGPRLRPPSGPAPLPGAPPIAHPRPTYSSLSQKFGAARVIRIKFSRPGSAGVISTDATGALRARLRKFLSGKAAPEWMISWRGSEGEFIGAPIDDFEAWCDALDLGEIVERDAAARSLSVVLDEEQVRSASADPLAKP